MMTAMQQKRDSRASDSVPPGKVRCFISKQIVDVTDTVEFDFHGVRVRVHRRYVAPSSDPAPIP